ncbi:hypothetical protein [Paenibacillus abyssi]|uniref:DnaD domain-containing protein n=1 Tax=Paenibacillus abyssi TaxID=1340531 RepID=A0A917LEY3_9BACL|nr:hypothetical protein [Paenibacillus abyssi]GGG17072.1 hypothetical protein GCM10010916_37390 [Paenibacillus abyssi]
MTNEHTQGNARNFAVSTDIFMQPGLDIYTQMTYIVLRSYTSESAMPTLSEIAQKGRMTAKQATKAMQSLVNHKMIPHKLFRQMIGEFQDDRLSWAAKGLLTYFKEHPSISVTELLEMSDQSGEDEQSILKALIELKSNGYLEEFPELSKLVD